jgi:glycosyltransferase involved in cell wall biosynthesis
VAINLVEGFRVNGIGAEFYSAENTLHPYDYPDGFKPNRCPKSTNKLFSKILMLIFLIKLVIRYKYFIFLQAGRTLMKDQKDIRILKFFGKKTMVVLVGCDARVPEKVEQYTWNPCTGCPDDYKQFVNCNIPRKKELIPLLEKRFDRIASPDECAGLIQGPYHTIYFPRNMDQFVPVYPKNEFPRKIKILHAPSHTHYKGTKYIRAAIAKLAKQNDNFEYIEKQGLQINELYEVITSCDLVIDQLIGGYYGLLSVESMALGKPVVVYIRPDIWEREKSFSPVFNANPDNLYEILEKILLNPGHLEQRGRESRAYVEKFHDAKILAQALYLNLSGQ